MRAYLYACLYGCLYVGVSECLPVDMSVCLPVLSYGRSIYLSIHLSICLPCSLSIVNKYFKQAVISPIEKVRVRQRLKLNKYKQSTITIPDTHLLKE